MSEVITREQVLEYALCQQIAGQLRSTGASPTDADVQHVFDNSMTLARMDLQRKVK